MNKKRVLKTIYVIVGTFLLALSIEMFIIPFDILSGGVAGIAVALEPFTHIGKTLFANCLMVGLLIIGGIFLGKEFLYTTTLSSLLYPVFTTLLMDRVIIADIHPVVASFYGGLLGGVGIGIVIKAGASTGGMDIPPLVLHKLTGIKVATLVMITDGLTVLLGFLAYDLSAVLIGLISVFSSTFAISKVLSMNGTLSKSVQIISDKYEEIIPKINEELERGATIFDAKGSYTGEVKKVILCVVSEPQYNELIDFVKEIDPNAFVITTDATDMHGEGFNYRFRL